MKTVILAHTTVVHIKWAEEMCRWMVFRKIYLKKPSAYAELLSKKKEIYAAYRKARGESRELLTVKANVDRVLGIEKDDAPGKEAPSETRS